MKARLGSSLALALLAMSCGTPESTAPVPAPRAHASAPVTSQPEPRAVVRPKPTGPTFAKSAHDIPMRSAFLPDGRFVAFTGAEAFVADPRSTEELHGLRRFPLRAGDVRIVEGGTRFLRIVAEDLVDLDTTTFTERKKLSFAGMIFYAVPNPQGTLALVRVLGHPASARHDQEVLVDLATFRVLCTYTYTSSGTAMLTADGKYIVVHPDDGQHRTLVIETASGTEVFRAKEAELGVEGSFVVAIDEARGTVTYEDIGTHKKTVTKLPCKGPVARSEGRAVVACGKKLTVFALAPGSKPTTLVAPAPILRVAAEGPTFVVSHANGVSRLEGGALSDCVGRTPDGREVARGPRMCGATLSPDGVYLARNGIYIERVSDGATVFDLPWSRAGSQNASAVVHENVVSSYDLVAGGAPGLAVPFDGPSARTRYLPLGRLGKVELYDVTTGEHVVTLPVEAHEPRVQGEGDEVLVYGAGGFSSGFARCSLAKATCTDVQGAPCSPAAFANGRGICLETHQDETQLTRFVLGSPSEKHTIAVPEHVDHVFPASKGFWLTATRGDTRHIEAFIAHVTDTSFDSRSIMWKKVPFPIQAISGDVAIAGGAGFPTTPPYTLFSLSSAETSQLVPYAKGAVRIYEDGRVAFWGEREEAERDLLCVDGDRVRTWAHCKDREVPW